MSVPAIDLSAYAGSDYRTYHATPVAGYTIDAQGVTWTPFVDNSTGLVGFTARHPDGRVRQIFLNPSSDDDDGTSTVFLYEADGDDLAVHSASAVTYLAPFGEGNREDRA